ncbi:tetratricopeptide repeat protein [Sulfuricurvum sp.]|uniref:tetratricopeptide repeat protein n=1 Tax=Sulfuricurvum sp. TaxID=2025608 RepID=UPI0026047047|nr:tetratricopeptide repeat protein [Sulfuricurvum sp.]MDD4950573.1 tetratricopeptide repeat protein [Sulfuricurvum sp.]
MFEPVKQLIIKQLIEEISTLNATNIELIGHNVVSYIESKRLIHHGINKDYMPSGYTVDTFSDDSDIVVEYSAEKGYFEDQSPKDTIPAKYEKIEKDIEHAIKHKLPTGPAKIYLISTQEEPPSFRAKYNATPIAKSYGSKTIIYDARELAKLIYEQSIESPTNEECYRQFLPTFAQNIDNYEYYGKVPGLCEKHISEPIILRAIKNHFTHGKQLCVLNGVSGAGKTQAVVDYIHSENSNFENILWISGDDWKPDTSLHSVKRSRGGVPINVAGSFNTSKTLLVIDNLDRTVELSQFSELDVGFTKGGLVLITSQLSDVGNEFYLSIPALSEDIAMKILGEDLSNPSDKCEEIVKACSFSPLILSTIRNLIDNENISKNELYTEVLSDPEAITGKDGLSIMSRILSKLNGKLLEALKKIANSGSNQHDFNFLNYFIGILHRHSLQKLSILLQTNIPGILKVHDLITKAVQDNLNTIGISTSIEEYINQNSIEMSPSVLREIHICYTQLCEENKRRGDREPDWITYALLQVEGEAKEDIYRNIFEKDILNAKSVASLLCIIDAKETHSYSIKDKDARSSYYEKCAEEYRIGIESIQNEDFKAELLHHRGKALRRYKRYDEALACFTQLLKLKPNWHATYGQIAHLGTQYGVDTSIKESGEEAMRKLVDFMIEDFSIVPLRVSLGALARLRSYQKLKNDLVSNREKVIALANIITISALEGLDQFYEAYVSFTSMFGYQYPEICVELAETLPEMFTMPPEAIDKYQWVSACEALTNTAIAAKSSGKIDLYNKMSNASLTFADKINDKEVLNSFNARAVAKAYIVAEKPQSAIDAIAKVSEQDINHWLLYRKAEALLALDDSSVFDVANNALDLALEDEKAKDNLSSYYDLKRQYYEKAGKISEALVEAKHAVENCKDGKYKLSLENALLRLEALQT